ncbi:4-alpha-glucanotransferase [Inquilinus sp. CAU 1745]|uniref:4-alpha-glucanotransferase n=1 Tax=Inquilinus sp. CAU 1745 TaxID=3140369 RepID=UPI00325C0327
MTILDLLAERAGIVIDYHDIWGKPVAVPDETKKALLVAMGLPAETADEQRSSLDRLAEGPWRLPLPPVVIVPSEKQPFDIPVTLPGGSGTPIRWTIRMEDGRVQAGESAPPVVECRELHDGAHGQRLLRLPELPEGYHDLEIASGEVSARSRVIVAPSRCWTPEDSAPGARMWGVSAQIYALRAEKDWGIGNLSVLADLAARAGQAGADLVGINPLHALFPVDPEQASPYSPSSRDFLNILAIDPTAVPEFEETQPSAEGGDLIDYSAVARRVIPALRRLHERFRSDASPDRRRAFEDFVAAGGQPLRRFAIFMALQEHFAGDDLARFAWWTWPEPCHDPGSEAVEAFARDHGEEVEFHLFAEWLADAQLAAAAAAGREGGLRLGLYRDLAIGAGAASASAWANPAGICRGVAIGAPPDPFSRAGQDWGLAPLNPMALSAQAFAPFIAALRANMRHAGALRIDHAMGLQRLFWIPEGRPAAEGAYVIYPLDAMLRVLALESRRHRCVVIGEDLGTVPEGFRDQMADAGVQSYKVLPFERVGDGLFRRAADYPPDALVTAGTHDLPTLAGFWTGGDIAWRGRLGLYPDEAAAQADRELRALDRRRLIDALIDAGLWPADPPTDSEGQPFDLDLSIAIHRFLARSPCRLMMVTLEDALGEAEQPNLPGTVTGHPNWRRRLPATVAEAFSRPDAAALYDMMRSERPRDGN